MLAPQPDGPVSRQNLLTRGCNISQQIVGVGVAYNGSWRKLYDDIVAIRPMFVMTLTMLPICGFIILGIILLCQRIQVVMGLSNDIPTASAIATVRAALWDMLLPSETYASISAPPCFDIDL